MSSVKLTKSIRDQITNEWEFNWQCGIRKPVIAIIATAVFRGKAYTGIGVAKCMSKDPWDKGVGMSIAMKRATRQMMQDIVKEFNIVREVKIV